tara:strand:- start:10977 stop:12191 length:1215 start_codon:yes stop_codon:yes gene_type:complete
MWGSALIEQASELPTQQVVKSHPMLKQLFNNGDGWFESRMGCGADELVKRLRKMRRSMKDDRSDIDAFIDDIRMIKALETEATIMSLSWGPKYADVMKQLGLSDRSLKSLRKFGESRSVSLQQACNLWNEADAALKMLDEFEDVWGEEEQRAWASAMSTRSDARKMWKNTLHQIDALSKSDQDYLRFAAEQLLEKGPMRSTDIRRNLHDAGLMKKSFTDKKLSSLLNLYGEEVDIIKGASRGTYVVLDSQGLVLKDPWAYSAGFLDADGYITITERGEPRAGFIATGDRGRLHCENLHKTLECGVLQLDNKVYKDSQRSQHRLQFYSKADIRKLLTGVLPHIRMKDVQAKAVLAFIDEKDIQRKEEMKRLVRYENWKDNTKKTQELLQGWGIDMDTIGKYAEGL